MTPRCTLAEVFRLCHSLYTFELLHIISDLAKALGSHDIDCKVTLLLEVEYLQKLKELRLSLGNALQTYPYTHVIFLDETLVGSFASFLSMAKSKFNVNFDESIYSRKYLDEATSETERILSKNGLPCVFLSFSSMTSSGSRGVPSDAIQYGKVIIELFDNICPKSCENFIRLCKGEEMKGEQPLRYLNSPIHRVVPGGWISCGDIIDGSGTNSLSVFADDTFEDESFSVNFSNPHGGIVGYASSGPHTNGSQFFITCGPCDWLNYKMVGFGRVVQGYDVIRVIERVSATRQRPTSPIYISAAGVIAKTIKGAE